MSSNLKSSPLLDRPSSLTSSSASGNNVLRELLKDPGVAHDLVPELKPVHLTVNQVLYEQGDKIEYVYFPLDCVVSVLGIMEDGTTVETAMIGREGLVGLTAILGSGSSRHWVWCSVDGSAVQLEARILDKLFLQNESALKLLLDCYRSLLTQTSQRCVCNTRHTILERLSCWLLMVHDRVGGPDRIGGHDRIGGQNLRLTQETIASRVGARRAGITVAAGLIQGIGAIEYRRGQLHIINRHALEEMVCECYAMMRTDSNGSEAAT